MRYWEYNGNNKNNRRQLETQLFININGKQVRTKMQVNSQDKSRSGNARYHDMLRSGECSVSWFRDSRNWTRLVSNVTEVLQNVTGCDISGPIHYMRQNSISQPRLAGTLYAHWLHIWYHTYSIILWLKGLVGVCHRGNMVSPVMGWILLVDHMSLEGVIYSGWEGCFSAQMIGAQLRWCDPQGVMHVSYTSDITLIA